MVDWLRCQYSSDVPDIVIQTLRFILLSDLEYADKLLTMFFRRTWNAYRSPDIKGC